MRARMSKSWRLAIPLMLITASTACVLRAGRPAAPVSSSTAATPAPAPRDASFKAKPLAQPGYGARPKHMAERPLALEPPPGISIEVVPVELEEVEPIYRMAPGVAELLPTLETATTPPLNLPPWLRKKSLQPADETSERFIELTPNGRIDDRPGRAPLAPDAATVSWDSFDLFDSGSIPPDPSGAAGLNHVVNVINSNYAFYNKAGGLTGSGTLQAFFAGLSNTPTFDPKVLYDTFENRFVIVALELFQSGPTVFSQILVAVSDDGNPSGTWRQAEINALTLISGENRFADYPGLAVDEDNIYITANMFGVSSGAFANSRIWRIRKGVGTGGFYDGGAAAVTAVAAPLPPAPNNNPAFNFTLQPAHMLGAHPNATVGTFFSAYNGLNSSGNELLNLYTMTSPTGTMTFTHEFVALGNIDNTAAGVPLAPQLAAVPNNIDSGRRNVYSSVWRNNSLYGTTTLVPPSGADTGQATAHWWRLSTVTLFTTTAADQGNIGGETIAAATHTFYPSVSVNTVNSVGFSFAASGPAIHPGAYFTFRLAGDAAGTVQPAETVAAGIDRYHSLDGTRNRWGDYSGVSFDPSNNCFWAYNEHSLTQTAPPGGSNNGVWGTRWAAFCLSAVCGNSVIEPGETCDPPGVPAGQPNQCRANCTACGDGTLQVASGEQCDDANNVNGDGCDATCVIEFCGNGVVQFGEECDPPGLPAGMPNTCRFNCTYCGDGNIYGGSGEMLINGDFELGNLTGWTIAATGSGSAQLDVPGTTAPISGLSTAPNAGGGSFYSVTDETGPGTHALSQTFTVPPDTTSALLTFDMFVNNWNSAAAGAPGPFGTFIDAAGLDHTTANPNQHARVDLMSFGSPAFDTGAGVVNNYYIGADALAPPVNPYTSYSIPITGDVVPGQTYSIRFADVGNMFFMNQGVDNVGLAVTTPAETCDDGNNLPGDGCTSTCELCAGPSFFAQTILAANSNTFAWASPADIDFVVGNLAAVSTYATVATGSATFATSLSVPSMPAPGAGFYVVVRTDCPGATWTSGGPGECNPPASCPPGGRDGNLPP